MKDLLPIGSVVLLKDATKKLVIIGVLQVNAEQNKMYDYLAVPYPGRPKKKLKRIAAQESEKPAMLSPL